MIRTRSHWLHEATRRSTTSQQISQHALYRGLPFSSVSRRQYAVGRFDLRCDVYSLTTERMPFARPKMRAGGGEDGLQPRATHDDNTTHAPLATRIRAAGKSCSDWQLLPAAAAATRLSIVVHHPFRQCDIKMFLKHVMTATATIFASVSSKSKRFQQEFVTTTSILLTVSIKQLTLQHQLYNQ